MAALHFHGSRMLSRSCLYDFFQRATLISSSLNRTPSRHGTLKPHNSAKQDQTTPSSRHFVLVHGMCHGGWSWYKLATLLSGSGHRFSAPDLAASGINPKRLEEVNTFEEYCEPLMEVMDAIPADERVVLVGHSYGGIPASLAMERFPHKIAAAVFVSALMPSTTNPLSEFFKDIGTQKFFTLSPEYVRDTGYHLCTPEDITLATLLLRPGTYFYDATVTRDDLVTAENHGSVPRVFVLCNQDKSLSREDQILIAEMSPGTEVLELDRADHMPMLSVPNELFAVLTDISDSYH